MSRVRHQFATRTRTVYFPLPPVEECGDFGDPLGEPALVAANYLSGLYFRLVRGRLRSLDLKNVTKLELQPSRSYHMSQIVN